MQATIMENQKYNGWTNYETWAVALWLDNEEASYRYWRMVAQEEIRFCKLQEEHREEAAIMLADRLTEEIHESLMGGVADLASDLMAAALSEVDWLEIAEHVVAEFREEY